MGAVNNTFISNLEPETAYNFTVIGFNSGGKSIPSDPHTVITLVKPEKPVDLRTANIKQTNLSIYWK